MDDAKKGLNTQDEYRLKAYKSMHDEAERKKEIVCSLLGPDSNDPYVEKVNRRFKKETAVGGELAYIEDLILKIKEIIKAETQNTYEDE